MWVIKFLADFFFGGGVEIFLQGLILGKRISGVSMFGPLYKFHKFYKFKLHVHADVLGALVGLRSGPLHLFWVELLRFF